MRRRRPDPGDVMTALAVLAGVCLAFWLVAVMTALHAKGDPPPPVSMFGMDTNHLYIISPVTNLRRWARTALMGNPGNGLCDPSGKFAAGADAAADAELARTKGQIADSALAAADSAAASLTSVTSQVPESCTHIDIGLAPGDGFQNLAGWVAGETSDPTCDWQTVWYPFPLARAPARSVEYSWPGGSARVSCRWARPWDTNSLTHLCSILRPACGGAGLTNVAFRTRRADLLGAKAGFDIAGVIPCVDGEFGWTGEVTNVVEGATNVLRFSGGFLVR